MKKTAVGHKTAPYVAEGPKNRKLGTKTHVFCGRPIDFLKENWNELNLCLH